MTMKTTHIVVETLGDHAAQGWWQANGRPKIQTYVVIEAKEAYDPCVQEALSFLHGKGAKMVHVLPYTKLPSIKEA